MMTTTAEWNELEDRRDLAAAFRWAARLGLNEGVCNHFSLAAPDAPDTFLVNPYRLHWSEMRASDLLLCRTDGAVLDGKEAPEDTAFHIHSRIHAARPDRRCVLHTHMPYATALTMIQGGRVEPVHQTSLRYTDRIAYDDAYGGIAFDAAEGERMARALGNRDLLMLANHGVVVLGPDVASAFDDLYFLERCCMMQVLAMSTGRPLRRIEPAIVERTAQQYAGDREQAGRAFFAAIRRILDREEPDYAN